MEILAESTKSHLKNYQATVQGRSLVINAAPPVPQAKWMCADKTMKVTFDVACTYLELLQDYVTYLQKVIDERKTQVGEVEKTIISVDEIMAEVKKRKESEPSVVISVVETPVMKKPAAVPTMIRK